MCGIYPSNNSGVGNILTSFFVGLVAYCKWVNTTHGAPSFSTSLGHYNEVVQSEEYLGLITRGALWACGKIDNPAYMTPYTGSNTVTEIPAKAAKKKNSNQ